MGVVIEIPSALKQYVNDQDEVEVSGEIAETYFHLAQQHRSAWTHEIDLRAFSDLAWWNHASTLAILED